MPYSSANHRPAPGARCRSAGLLGSHRRRPSASADSAPARSSSTRPAVADRTRRSPRGASPNLIGSPCPLSSIVVPCAILALGREAERRDNADRSRRPRAVNSDVRTDGVIASARVASGRPTPHIGCVYNPCPPHPTPLAASSPRARPLRRTVPLAPPREIGGRCCRRTSLGECRRNRAASAAPSATVRPTSIDGTHWRT